jgi:hypothetical protein
MPLTHGYGTIEVSISIYTSRYQVTLWQRLLKNSFIQNYSLIRSWKIKCERKNWSDIAWPSGFHSLLDIDNKIFYGRCRKNTLLHFNKFYFHSVMNVINFSEKRPYDSFGLMQVKTGLCHILSASRWRHAKRRLYVLFLNENLSYCGCTGRFDCPSTECSYERTYTRVLWNVLSLKINKKIIIRF